MRLFKHQPVIRLRPNDDKVQVLLCCRVVPTWQGALLLGLCALWMIGPAIALAGATVKLLGFGSIALGLFTLQGGNFQLGGGGPVANGSVVLTLSNPSATIIATGGAATAQYIINLDANGNIPNGTQVYGNNELTPAGTFYTAQVFTGANGTGTQVGQNATWIVGPSAPYAGTLYPNVLVLPPVSFTGVVTFPSVTVTFSATPNFNAALGSTFKITLTGNVTSSTLTGALTDQILIFEITQDGTGGRTFVWPANVKNPGTIDTSAGVKNIQMFRYDGSNAWPIADLTFGL